MAPIERFVDYFGGQTKTASALVDQRIAEAVDAAKSAGLPQGLIVALLQGQALRQTQMMVN
jgi:hypothetical protein